MKHVQFKLLSLCAASAILIAGCGGGGGGSNTAVVDNNTGGGTNSGTSTAINLALNDQAPAGFAGTGFGTWTGDGGNDSSGGLDAGGAAGDGEFVKVRLSFSGTGTGTLDWTILQSQYGKVGTTGTLQLQTDATNGGYKVVNGGATQSNIFVSKSGQVSGSLPLPIGANNAIKDALFNGVRFKDATTATLADVAGTYGLAALSKVIAGAPATSRVDLGVFGLNADGTGRVCPDTYQVSSNCQDGFNITFDYDDPANKNLIRIRNAAGVPGTLDILAVVKRFKYGDGTTDGLSLTGDVVASDASGVKETGALYASRVIGSPVDLKLTEGAWNVAITDVGKGGVRFDTKAAFAAVGGEMKSAIQGLDQCFVSRLNPGPINGAVTATNVDPTSIDSPSYAILMDADTAVFIDPGFAIGLMRKFSDKATDAGACQPS